MITFIRGIIVDVLPTQITVESAGIGYEILIPLSSFDRLPAAGSEIKILTHLAVREDAHVLYGFMSAPERDLFRMLINTVSGIGPKLALNILSAMNPAEFRGAIAQGDVKALTQISGVGKKSAERIIVELKDKVGDAALLEATSDKRKLTAENQKLNDAAMALLALGYHQQSAYEAVRSAAQQLGNLATVEDMIKMCLKKG